MIQPPPVLIVKAGTTDPQTVALHGDYDDWFIARLPGGTERCTVVSIFQGEALPDPRDFGGVIVTGSRFSVRDQASWMPELGRWMLDTAEGGTPVLAVCFGHQVLGESLGGRVGPNPDGPEVGTVSVDLTAEGLADPLFTGFTDRFEAQATHWDGLVRPPTDPRATRLAGNANSAWQAFAVGPLLRAVQFHPELPEAALRHLVALRERQAEVRSCPAGPRLLETWDRVWVRQRRGLRAAGPP